MTTEQKDLIRRMTGCKCSMSQIAYTLQLPQEEVNMFVIMHNMRTNARKSPAQMPDSYFITRLKQGKTPKDIADELGCQLSGIYRILKARDLTRFTFEEVSDDRHDMLGTHTVPAQST